MTHAAGAALSQHAGRIGLALLWLAAGLAAFAPAQEPPQAQRPQVLERVMEPVAGGSGVALAIAPDGDVWWVTAERALRLAAGEPTRARVALDLPRRGVGPGADPIAAAHVDPEGGLWLGTRRGSLSNWRHGWWRELEGGFRARGPIAAIATRGDPLYVAARGLWRGPRSGPLEEVAAFAGLTLSHAIAHPEHGVVVATGGVVWRGDEAGWRPVWRRRGRAVRVTALAFSPGGELWIGTGGGLVRIDRGGRPWRELPGVAIDALVAGEAGSAYAGTRGSGLYTRYAGAWRRVDAVGALDVVHVDRLAAAPFGALWLGMGESGLFRAGPASTAPSHVSAR